MIQGFWYHTWKRAQEAHTPLFAVAPMADVTDPVFRKLIAEKSRMGSGIAGTGPDIMWTEFVSADGLASEQGRPHLLPDLAYSEAERPIVAQIFGNKPHNMEFAARIAQDLGYNGVDINMGCPDRTIMEQGAGSALIQTPELAKEVIQAVKRGAPLIPVSVKTRIGYNTISWQSWLPVILDERVACITIHLRTRKELSLVPAHWELAGEIATFIRARYGTPRSGGPVILFNGDVKNRRDGITKMAGVDADGVMIGRGLFGDPYVFDSERVHAPHTYSDLLTDLMDHTTRFATELPHKSLAIMKKHFKAYIHTFPLAKELRMQLMDAKTLEDMRTACDEFIRTHGDHDLPAEYSYVPEPKVSI